MFRPHGAGYQKEKGYTDDKNDATQNNFINLQEFLVYGVWLPGAAPVNKLGNKISACKPTYQTYEKAYQ